MKLETFLACIFLMLAVSTAFFWESLDFLIMFCLVSSFVMSGSFFAGQAVRSSLLDMVNHPSSDPGPRENKVLSNDSVAPPTRQQLQALKKTLEIDKGSLQYKKRGNGVYWVKYENGKYCWTHLGSWESLKEKLEN